MGKLGSQSPREHEPMPHLFHTLVLGTEAALCSSSPHETQDIPLGIS